MDDNLTAMPNKNRLRFRAGTALFLCALLGFVSGCSVTIGGKKMPFLTHRGIHGEVVLEAERNINEQTTGNDTRKNETTEVREKIQFETEGYIYHPNLMTFGAGLGIGLLQHQVDLDGEKDKGSGTVNEYNFTGNILPNKPYPVRFYLRKNETFTPRMFSSSLRSETESSGIRISLRETEWPMQFSYGTTDMDQSGLGNETQDEFSRKDERLRFSTQHQFSKNSLFDFDFERQEIDQKRSTLSHTLRKEDKYDLKHRLTFGEDKQHRLYSNLSYSDETGDFKLERFRLSESLSLKHTKSLSTRHAFSYSKSTRDSSENETSNLSTGFVHRLYHSLTTQGTFRYSDESQGNNINTKRTGIDIGFDYRKKNRWGTFGSNYFVGFLKLEQEGGGESVSVIDEPHAYTTAGAQTFQLVRRNIDPTTIDIEGIGLYSEPADYIVRQADGVTFIEVVGIGGAIINDGDQILLVDYDYLIEPERTEDAVTQNFGIRQTFNNGLSLYYKHSRRDEDIDSTETDILKDEFRTNTYGADYQNKGFRLSAEYTDKDSTLVPYTSKRIQTGYSWRINAMTNAGVHASQNWSNFEGSLPHEVTTFIAGASLTSRLTDKYSVSSSVNYHRATDTLVNSSNPEGYKIDTHLKYAFRQLRVLTGIEYSTLKTVTDKTDRTLLYMKLKRLF